MKMDLEIISQERHLLSEKIVSITAPTVHGEVTVLPEHVSLFTRLEAGELIIRTEKTESSFVISGGFMDVSHGKKVTILADSAIHSDEINLAKAQEAKRRAERMMADQGDQLDRRELIRIEAELKRSLWEIKIARKRGMGTVSSD